MLGYMHSVSCAIFIVKFLQRLTTLFIAKSSTAIMILHGEGQITPVENRKLAGKFFFILQTSDNSDNFISFPENHLCFFVE